MNFRSLLRIFFPEKCPFCGEIIPIGEKYCTECSGGKSRISDDFCPHCAQEQASCLCGSGKTVCLPHVAAVYVYGGQIKELIADFKFKGKTHLARAFGRDMCDRVAQVFADADFDCLCFVPISEKTMEERGYNQTRLLAEEIAKRLLIPLEDNLVKIRETAKQHELSAKERLTNLTDSIALKDQGSVAGKTVLLCDDIKTTGATLGECVTALMQGGAKDVYCICLAAPALEEF